VYFVCFDYSELVVNTSAVGCLEKLICEMTHYMSSRMLNPAHSCYFLVAVVFGCSCLHFIVWCLNFDMQLHIVRQTVHKTVHPVTLIVYYMLCASCFTVMYSTLQHNCH